MHVLFCQGRTESPRQTQIPVALPDRLDRPSSAVTSHALVADFAADPYCEARRKPPDHTEARALPCGEVSIDGSTISLLEADDVPGGNFPLRRCMSLVHDGLAFRCPIGLFEAVLTLDASVAWGALALTLAERLGPLLYPAAALSRTRS